MVLPLLGVNACLVVSLPAVLPSHFVRAPI